MLGHVGPNILGRHPIAGSPAAFEVSFHVVFGCLRVPRSAEQGIHGGTAAEMRFGQLVRVSLRIMFRRSFYGFRIYDIFLFLFVCQKNKVFNFDSSVLDVRVAGVRKGSRGT